ncbi:uncharacterized protein LOC131955238 [Physella acuta]|uniref:uncharacterized protein LOC131955238 n=1 Tax=Physella acuta TaxID=109671 RepID=UPI0027DE45BB|nr:uncharacterized protein LOC131955238 [Physella acuta]
MTNETNDSHHLTTSMSFYLTKSGSYIADVNTSNSDPNKTTQTYGSYKRENVKNSNPDLSHNETKLNTVDSRNTSGFTKTHNGVYVNTKKSSKKISNYVSRNGESIKSLSTEDEEKKKDKHRKLKFSEMPRRSKYALLIIAMANFGAGCGFSLPAPFFPREAQLKQASPTAIGLVFSSYQLVNFIACPIFGNFVRTC